MSRAQRVVLFIYSLLIVYCCVWVPWHVNLRTRNDVRLGYTWIWSGPDRGALDTAAIILRLVAATALGAAAFLLARKWKAILFAAIIAGMGFAGILLHRYWTDRVAERRTQKIHDCAVAKVATAKCRTTIDLAAGLEDAQSPKKSQAPKGAPASSKPEQKDIFDFIAECSPYGLSDNPTAQEEDTAIAAAEKECTGENDPKQKSSHEQIEEYKRQHGMR